VVMKANGQCAALALVARTLREPFTMEELTLAAWEAYPMLFGLPGHEMAYPSDHRVSSSVFATRGPLRRGLLRKVEGGYACERQAVEE
jgi:hypothetical protein